METIAKSFLLLLLLLVGFAVAAVVDCNTEVDILHAQRIAWLDPNGVLQSWDPSLVNPCTWFHVTCNNDNSVIRVDLGEAGLIGPLVPQLGNLRNLQYLELYANSVNGTIPKELGQLRNLVSLGLQQNRLSGTIPSSLGDIKSLEFLTLNGNELTGNLPVKILKLIAIGNLRVLNVSDNYLEGTRRKSGFATTQVIQDQRAFR